MKPGFGCVVVLAMALSGPIDLLAGHGQKPKTAQKETQKKAYSGCWPGESEIERDKKRVRSFVPVAITLHLK